jgi:hypothetical protein
MRGEYNMDFNKKQVVVNKYFYSLEGDVWVDNITTISGDAQVRDYMNGKGELVRRDYTVVEWSHDGISCIDVYITLDGCIEVYVQDTEDEDDEDDVLFMAVYNGAHASIRLDTFDIPEVLRESFISTATQRMDFK